MDLAKLVNDFFNRRKFTMRTPPASSSQSVVIARALRKWAVYAASNRDGCGRIDVVDKGIVVALAMLGFCSRNELVRCQPSGHNERI